MRLVWTGPRCRAACWALIVVLTLTGCLPPGPERLGAASTMGAGGPVGRVAATTRASEVHPEIAERAYGTLPLLFVENRGQTDRRVTYYVQAGGASVFFTPTTVTHLLRAPVRDEAADPKSMLLAAPGDPSRPAMRQAQGTPAEPKRWQRWAVEVELVGADPTVRPRGEAPAPTVVSYFKGLESDWRAGLPTYTGIVYPDAWAGIDLVYESAGGRLKSSYVVRPGADPRQIVLAYRGAASVGIGEAGALDVGTPVGGFREEAPVAFQDRGGERVAVGAGYRVEAAPDLGASLVTFDLAPYDPTLPLVIDPVVLYSRSIDGPGFDAILNVKVDAAGNAYFVGYSEGLPAGVPVAGPDTSFNGNQDALVGKLNADGTALAYLGFIGSNGTEQGVGVAVDAANRAYVLGQTDAPPAGPGNPNGFPILGALDQTYGGSKDAFVARVNAAGTGLEYAGYVGGGGQEDAGKVAVDQAGSAYVVGTTTSTRANGFPWKVGPGTDNFGGFDGFVAKVQSDGNGFVYAGFVGTTSGDNLTDVAVDTAGHAYLLGNSRGLNAGRTDTDVFVVKLDPGGTAFLYSPFWGGTNEDVGYGVVIDAAGHAYVAGHTNSANFPDTVGSTLRGQTDAFVSKVNPQGDQFVYSRFIGGDGVDTGFGLAVDGAGNVYLAGATESSPAQGFPIFGGPDSTFGGLIDGFIVKVLPTGTGFGYGTYFGGGPNTPGAQLTGIAVDAAGNAYATGLVVDSIDPVNVTLGVSGFVGKIGEGSPPPPPPTEGPCAPRPPVRVATVRSAAGTLQVTITASTSAGTPANALREIRFGAARNALIDLPQGPTGLTGPYTQPLAAGSTQATFTVRRAGGGAFTAPLVVVDGCGDWPTFVGGGANVP